MENGRLPAEAPVSISVCPPFSTELPEGVNVRRGRFPDP